MVRAGHGRGGCHDHGRGINGSWQRQHQFADTATLKITIYDVTEGATLVLDCHGGPMR